MAAAEVELGETSYPQLPILGEEGQEGRTKSPTKGKEEEGKTPSVWHSNPIGLAETLRKQEETRRAATYSHMAGRQRKDKEYPTIEVQAQIKEDKVSISVPQEIIERNSNVWENALVGRFTGPRPDLDRIRKWADMRWKVKGLEILALPKGCILLNFQNKEDMIGALLKAPWYMEGKGLLLEKWHKDYSPKNEGTLMIPVWVHIPDLPLQSWDKDIIRSIANAIGKLVAIDSATSNKTRLIQARFCVLVRTDKPIPTKVELEMEGKIWSQNIIYEGVMNRCFKCRKGGHLPQFCQEKGKDHFQREETTGCREDNTKRDKKEDKETEEEHRLEKEGEEGYSDKELSKEAECQVNKDEDQTGKETSSESEEDSIKENEERETDSGEEEDTKQEELGRNGKRQEGAGSEKEEVKDGRTPGPTKKEPKDKGTKVRTMEKQKEKIVVQFESEEENVEEQNYWQKVANKKDKQKEKQRQKNQEMLDMVVNRQYKETNKIMADGRVDRYPIRNKAYYDRSFRKTPDVGAKRPGRPTNQEARERESPSKK